MNYRKKFLISTVGIVGILLIMISLGYTQSRSDIESVFKTACETLEESIKETHQGTGTAKVFVQREGVTPQQIKIDKDTGEHTIVKPEGKNIETIKEKFLTDFAFKGETSISKRYEIKKDSKRGELLSATIFTPEIKFHYDRNLGFGARAPIKSFRAFYRELGYDFHPETLTRFSRMAFARQMQIYLEDVKTIKMNSISNDLLRIELEGAKNDNQAVVSIVLLLNPQANFRPIEYKYSGEDKRIVYSETYQAKWRQYSPNYWYITNLKYGETFKDKGKLPRKKKVEIEVLSFDPDIKIEDSVFDFKNLDIPKGTPINDQIEGKYYKWGEQESEEKEE